MANARTQNARYCCSFEQVTLTLSKVREGFTEGVRLKLRKREGRGRGYGEESGEEEVEDIFVCWRL